MLNMSLAQCEAACLGQGASTNHIAGKSCTAVNYDETTSGCVMRAEGNGHTGAPATQPWPFGTGYAYMPKQMVSGEPAWDQAAGASMSTQAEPDDATALVTTFSIFEERERGSGAGAGAGAAAFSLPSFSACAAIFAFAALCMPWR